MNELRILFSFLFCLMSFCGMGQEWEQMDGPHEFVTGDLFSTEDRIWLGTQSGLYYTEDDGFTWKIDDVISHQYKVEYNFVKGDTIILVTNTGDIDHRFNNNNFWIYYSDNGGIDWESLDVSNFKHSYNDLIFINQCIYVRANEKIVKSCDKGISWEELDVTAGRKMGTDGQRIFVYDRYEAYYSDNFGETFIAVNSPEFNFDQVFMSDSLFICYSNYSITVSHNLGLTWDHIDFRDYFINGIFKSEDGDIYLLGAYNFISTDNGRTWNQIENENITGIYNIRETDDGKFLSHSYGGLFRVNKNTYESREVGKEIIVSQVE